MLRPAMRYRILIAIISLLLGNPAGLGATPVPLTIVTYNINGGVGADGRRDLVRQAEILRGQNADIILLQQVEVGTARINGTDQAAELARLLGMNFYFAKAADFDGGQRGNVILARHPLENTRTLPLPGGGGKSAALAEIAVPRRGAGAVPFRLALVCAQLDTRIGAQPLQAEAVTEAVAAFAGSVIWGGDFNADPRFPLWEKLRPHWNVLPRQGGKPAAPEPASDGQNSHFLLRANGAFQVQEHRVLAATDASSQPPLRLVVVLREK